MAAAAPYRFKIRRQMLLLADGAAREAHQQHLLALCRRWAAATRVRGQASRLTTVQTALERHEIRMPKATCTARKAVAQTAEDKKLNINYPFCAPRALKICASVSFCPSRCRLRSARSVRSRRRLRPMLHAVSLRSECTWPAGRVLLAARLEAEALENRCAKAGAEVACCAAFCCAANARYALNANLWARYMAAGAGKRVRGLYCRRFVRLTQTTCNTYDANDISITQLTM